MSSSEIRIKESNNWGSNIIYACSDVMLASDDKISIIKHRGSLSVNSHHFMTTLSNICEDKGVEVVVYGYEDHDVLYPHITFIKEEA